MKSPISIVAVSFFLMIPFLASAHQHATYEIGGVEYEFTIGSLNEPIVVDDKTGVDFRVARGQHGSAESTPVTGLENDLKVELIAGDKRKILDLVPVYNTPGSYKATFFPTIPTTLSYRIFGTINDTPVDLTFTCAEEGQAAVDEGEKEISAGVTQIMKGGGFGCPAPKSDLGFPEPSSSINDLAGSDDGDNTGSMAMAGLIFGILGFIFGGGAYMRRGA